MILTPHILVGAAIGSKFSWPAVFFIGFLSHYLLDALPHYEYDISDIKYKKIQLNKAFFITLLKLTGDFCLGLLIVLLFIFNNPHFFMAAWGVFSSLLPDGLLFLYWNFPNNRLLKFFANPHRASHYLKNKSPVWLGLIIEIIVSLAALIFLALCFS
jgi:hypothetical protein